jgi:hypothetical protein
MEKKVIGIELQTGDAVKAANNLDKSVTDLSASFEDVYGEMQPLSGRMGELEDRMYELALAGQSNTQEFKDLEKEVGKYKKTIMEVDLAVDAAAQTMGQKLGGSLEFASGGFTAIQGAAASFGVESAALEESILKVQSAMAITQGINSMREGFKSVSALASGFAVALGKTVIGQKLLTVAQYAGAVAMRVLNAVMNANPVFLLITGITALIGAIVYFSSETEKAEAMNNKLNKSYEDTITLTDKIGKNLKRNADQALKKAELEGKSEKDLHDIRVKNLEDEEKLRSASSNLEKVFIKEKQKAYSQALKEGNNELAKTIKEEISESRKRYDDLKGQHKDYINNKINEDLDYNNKAEAQKAQDLADTKAKNKEAYDNYKAYQQRRLSVQQEIEDLRLGLIADGEFKEIEILNINAERKKQLALSDTTTSQNEKEALIRVYEQVRQAEEQKIRDNYLAKEKELNQKVAEEKAIVVVPPPEFAIPTEDAVNPEIEAEIFTKQQLREINDNYYAEQSAKHAEFMQEKINQSQGYFDAANQSLQALDDLNSLLTDKAVADAGANEAAAEKARKKGFERSKKIQITMAVIQGVQGVMSAFTAGSSMGPAGVVMGPLMAALAAVTAGINIAKIKATKYEGGGGGGGASVPQSVPNPASFNVVGDAGTNQIAETLGQQNMNPQKAYVVSGDVTSAQSLERNKIENASL